MTGGASHAPLRRVYVHVPFCPRRCDYCAFHSLALPEDSHDAFDAYLRALAASIRRRADALPIGPLESLYVGGGTPTHPPLRWMERLFALLRDSFALSPGAEVTIECNPLRLDAAKARLLASFADRVSIGVQSFDPLLRAVLGRSGEPRLAFQAAESLAAAGVSNLSVDLIYGVPGQCLDGLLEDARLALSCGVRHLSAYALTIEEGHALPAAAGLRQPGDDEQADMWESLGGWLAAAGLRRYEVSNHAIPGFECRHNVGVWLGEPYLGLGPSASSFDGRRRWTEAADFGLWLGGAPPEYDDIPDDRRDREVFAMGLRLRDGWPPGLFERVRGADWRQWPVDWAGLEAAGLLSAGAGGVRLTDKGLLLWDAVAEAILL